MSAPADPLSAEERALLEDIAQGPVSLYVPKGLIGPRERAYFYGHGPDAPRRHAGGTLVRLFARGWCDANETCDAFAITDAGRAALQDLRRDAA